MKNGNVETWVSITAIFLLMAFLLLIGSEANEWLRYSREKIISGQLWRLLTAHLVHLNYVHGMMNLSVFLLTILIVGSQLSVWRWLFAGISISLFNSLCLFLFTPTIDWYVGFSGVLHGLLVLGLTVSCVGGNKLHGFALLLLVTKVLWEQLPDFDVNHLQSYINAPVVVDAHLYGAIGGFLLASFFLILKRYSNLAVLMK